MKHLRFSKYSGCGNDFILIDGRAGPITLAPCEIAKLCARKHGIGADGIIIIEPSLKADFKMRIFNADGSEAEMCGNGIRCLADFVRRLGFSGSECTIESMKRFHKATWDAGKVIVTMGEPTDIVWDIEITIEGAPICLSYLDTGVPHAVLVTDDIHSFDISGIGRQIRHHPRFAPKGTNVNAIQIQNGKVAVRTYERGVEAETEACGTGATAAAIVAAKKFSLPSPIDVGLLSGETLTIDFAMDKNDVTEVKMSGACTHIFDGTLDLI